MTSKRKLRERIAELEFRERFPSQAPAIDTLHVDFVRRSVTYRGRTIYPETDAVDMPILNFQKVDVSKL